MVKIGDNIKFGEYNWRVLDVQGDRAFIITETVIDDRKYHDEKNVSVTWEICSLRSYLNGEFYDSFVEKDRIIPHNNTNPDNLWYGTKGGNDTIDKIFLLSLLEVDKYFGNSGDYSAKRNRCDLFYAGNGFSLRKGMPKKRKHNAVDTGEGFLEYVPDKYGWFISNAYDDSRSAREHYDWEDYNNELVGWRLRSPGKSDDFIASVMCEGAVSVFGGGVNVSNGVRPALWLKLDESKSGKK